MPLKQNGFGVVDVVFLPPFRRFFGEGLKYDV
jgi:hypothetical protein